MSNQGILDSFGTQDPGLSTLNQFLFISRLMINWSQEIAILPPLYILIHQWDNRTAKMFGYTAMAYLAAQEDICSAQLPDLDDVVFQYSSTSWCSGIS